jgi:hypothetical protein
MVLKENKTGMLYAPLKNFQVFSLLDILCDLSAGAGQEV